LGGHSILIGKVQTKSERIESKELRYAKKLVERGETSRANEIINNIIHNSKDSDVVAEAIYLQVLWRLSTSDIEALEKLEAYYPNSIYVSRLANILFERKEELKRYEAKYGKVINRYGNYLLYSNRIVFDKKTNLDWYAGPDRNTNWNEAKAWVESLNVAGGGWRMPTIKELRTLYKKGAGARNMTNLLKTTGWWLWSGEIKDSSKAWAFHLGYGYEYWTFHGVSSNDGGRGFAVRSRK